MLTEAAMVLAALTAQDPGVDLTTFLDERLGLSDNEVSEVRAGDVVTRKLETVSDREVALVGVVRVDVSRVRFLESFMDVESFLIGESVRRAGKFSSPPVVADLAALGLADEDIQALRDCRIGDCDVKLSAERINEIGALDWSAPENRARLERMGRAWLLEYVEDYLDRGDSALVIYDDRDDPQPLHEGFHALLAESPYVFRYAPELHHYLDAYPSVALGGAHDFLFWTVLDVGLKPITTLTHATVYPWPAGGTPWTVIALKQIYASHYFHAALGLLTLVDAEGGDSVYLVYLDRSLFDTKIGWLRRGAVEGRLEDHLRTMLQEIRERFSG